MQAKMYILGLEGSANKLGVAVLKDTEVLANVRDTFVAPLGEGFRPSEITKHHRDNIISLIKQALTTSGITVKELGLICYTRGPGMGGPLASVALVAKTLALKLRLPLQAVNHCVAHAEMARHCLSCKNPVILYASGGNTQILGLEKQKYRIFGEALDVAVGNCLDRAARDFGVSNDPAPGLNIELLARKWQQREKLLEIPIPVKGMDISCAGINSFCLKEFEGARKLVDGEAHPFLHSFDELQQFFCFSLQENLFSALVEITERAVAHLRAEYVLCVGGVGCNLRLQQMLEIMCEERNIQFGGMDERFCIDNGAMIGLTGYLEESNGIPPVDAENAGVVERWRTDQVDVTW